MPPEATTVRVDSWNSTGAKPAKVMPPDVGGEIFLSRAAAPANRRPPAAIGVVIRLIVGVPENESPPEAVYEYD
jgi:hypothetical protein